MEYASKECVLFLVENAVCRRAEHVLVLICWQIVGKQKFSANTHGTKIFREVAETDGKRQKNPAPSNESAGILGAASRKRTGTGLTPGDFKFSDGGEKYIILFLKHGYKCNIFCKM